MATTLVGIFESMQAAERAREQLLQQGINAGSVHITNNESITTERTTVSEDEHRGFFSRLFGLGDSNDDADTYVEAMRRGSSMLTVTLADNSDAERVTGLLESAGAIDIDSQRSQSRGASLGTDGDRNSQTANLAGSDRLEVVQEDLQVGKRAVETGGVRVRQYVTERPVHEQIQLCEERAIVNRRPVDRVLSPQEAASMNLQDREFEIREHHEEAMVNKTARVVEEVEVGKEMRERTETIDDTVRRTDVDVEQLTASQQAMQRNNSTLGNQSPR